MNPVSIAALAKLFKIGGALVGMPSIVVLALYAVLMWRRRLAAPAPETNVGDNPDALLLMLQGLTRVVVGVADLVGALAQFVLDVAAAAAGAGLVIAIVLWFTGRGLQAQATWARCSGFALLTLAMLAALLLALSFHGVGRIAMLALLAFTVLALHALWVGAPSLAA
ncbi:MAG: hypothetical protein QM722_05105 [Piscinibacter sp.]